MSSWAFSPNGDNPSVGGPCGRVSAGVWQVLPQQLCVQTVSGKYYGGEVGQWAWRPPGGSRSHLNDGPGITTDAYIYRADVRHSYTRFSASGSSFMYSGIRSGRSGNYRGRSHEVRSDGIAIDHRDGQWSYGVGVSNSISNPSFYRMYCAATDCSVEHPNDSDIDGAWFTFGMYALGPGHSAFVNAQGATFYQYDRSAPTATQSTSTDLSGWKKNGTVSTFVTGSDKGMGMHRVGLSTGAAQAYGCTGGLIYLCPPSLGQTFSTKPKARPPAKPSAASNGVV